ncbi:MAG: glycosyltransferase family 2 protein [Bacteroidota bacterium]
MDVSIIIVNYNTTALTLACLQSIYKHTMANTFEVIIIDNASQDESISSLQHEFPKTMMIYNDVNVGFGRANNQGIEISQGKYIFLLNSDTELTSDAVAVFYDYMEEKANSKLACCGADLIAKDGSPRIAYGNFPSFAEAFSALGFLVLYRKYFSRHLSSGVYNYSSAVKVVNFLCGADFFVRSSVLEKVGHFDPQFFLYFEETELAFRMSKAGYKSVLIPEVQIIHHESGSDELHGEYYLQKASVYAKSRKLYFRKTKGLLAANLINKIYAVQAFIQFCISRKTTYLSIAKMLLKN